MLKRLTVPDVMPVVREFLTAPGNSVGGHLHIVLDDGNIGDQHIQSCLDDARKAGDALAVKLAEMLLQLTKTQRRRIVNLAYELP